MSNNIKTIKNNFISENINSIYNPISFNDVVHNKLEIIHNNMFRVALDKYIAKESYTMTYNYINSYINNNELYAYNVDLDIQQIYNSYVIDLKTNYRWIEKVNNNNYSYPSYVLQISRKKPFNKRLINLTNFWNNDYIKQQNVDNLTLQYKEDEELLNVSEIEYYDYVRERVQLGNKHDNEKITLKFSDLNNNLKPNKNLFIK